MLCSVVGGGSQSADDGQEEIGSSLTVKLKQTLKVRRIGASEIWILHYF
jgi:hypothetical protein